jgi:cytidylate kinase
MALITLSGAPGCRTEEVARICAQRLRFELITESRLRAMMQAEFGAASPIPDRAYPHVVASMLARIAVDHHLVAAAHGSEVLFNRLPGTLRVQIGAPESRRVGSLMIDFQIERPAALELLHKLEEDEKADRKRKFGRSVPRTADFDLILNEEFLDSEQMASIIQSAVSSMGLVEHGFLSAGAEAQLQFQVRLQLAKYGMAPPGKTSIKRAAFMHPSEEIFANLLDFYRIAWEYEPRSFPVQWGKDGKPLESFTPDFYLPEVDLYVELTTMKQAHVTKKNRKVKLLRTLYPHINIQVFYQKDFQNLIFKYGLADRAVKV